MKYVMYLALLFRIWDRYDVYFLDICLILYPFFMTPVYVKSPWLRRSTLRNTKYRVYVFDSCVHYMNCTDIWLGRMLIKMVTKMFWSDPCLTWLDPWWPLLWRHNGFAITLVTILWQPLLQFFDEFKSGKLLAITL